MKTSNTKSNSRTTATKIICAITQQGLSLNNALADKITPKTPDRAFIQELCYGVSRWYFQLEEITKQLLTKSLKDKDSDIKVLILIGIYQLLHLKTPEHAAIHETVEAARQLKKPWAAGLINAVLRNFLRRQTELLSSTASHAHPAWLVNNLQQAWPDNWESIITANNQRPPMTLRINQLKIDQENYLQKLAENNIKAFPVNDLNNAIMLEQACDVAQLPGFSEGFVSVQDAAAQLAAELLELAPNQRVLDACAAPGGKTAHILETEPNLDYLLAIDVEEKRLKKISENLERLKLQEGSPSALTRPSGTLPLKGEGIPVKTTPPNRWGEKNSEKIKLLCADAANSKDWWNGQLFDRILLDAPCSATGVIRRHPDIKLLRRAGDITALTETQLKLLEALWPLLKPDGLLLYATCSVLPQENYQVLEEFLATHPDAEEKFIETNWGIKTKIGKQIFPQTNGMDGFYYAKIIKASL